MYSRIGGEERVEGERRAESEEGRGVNQQDNQIGLREQAAAESSREESTPM